MANHKSAKKRLRQSLKRRDSNRVVKSTVRTLIKEVRAQVEAGELDGAQETARKAEKKIAQASSQGVYHPKNASRKVHRLFHAISRARSA